METFIPEQDILNRIKTHPDLSANDKEDFYFDLQMLYLTEKGKEKINKPIIKNQQRNKTKK
jgi:predicted type IV restriction endonuclease